MQSKNLQKMIEKETLSAGDFRNELKWSDFQRIPNVYHLLRSNWLADGEHWLFGNWKSIQH